MEKDNHDSETDVSTPCLKEGVMAFTMGSPTVQSPRRTIPTNPCIHRRALDEVLTRGKKRIGKVRCLECGAIFDDPYLNHE